jgi:hypothetical protein
MKKVLRAALLGLLAILPRAAYAGIVYGPLSCETPEGSGYVSPGQGEQWPLVYWLDHDGYQHWARLSGKSQDFFGAKPPMKPANTVTKPFGPIRCTLSIPADVTRYRYIPGKDGKSATLIYCTAGGANEKCFKATGKFEEIRKPPDL